MASGLETNGPRPGWVLWARWVIGCITAIAGPAVALLATAIGHCSAFGGRCPADPVPLLQDDVFGTVAAAMAVTVVVVGLCLRPGIRGATAGLVAAVPVGLMTGLAAAAYARG